MSAQFRDEFRKMVEDAREQDTDYQVKVTLVTTYTDVELPIFYQMDPEEFLATLDAADRWEFICKLFKAHL